MDIKMDIKELEDIKLLKLEDLHMLLLIIENLVMPKNTKQNQELHKLTQK